MTESVRHLLRQSADTVERPQLDVGALVARAERRMLKRRVAAVAASAVAVTAVVVAGAVAQGPDDRRSVPPPVGPVETPQPPEPTPVVGAATYFAAHPGDSGEPVTIPFADLGQSDLYLRRDGQSPRPIVATRADERCPTVSPDGASLAYLSGPYDDRGEDRPANVVVVSLDAAGVPAEGARRVVLRKAVPSCPQWSPDGQRLAVVAEGQDWSKPELRVVTPDGKGQLLTILPPYVYTFAWSPDGDAVAYLTEDAVWIAPVRGGEPKLFWRSTRTPDRTPQGIPLPRAPVALSWLGTGDLAVVVLSDKAADGWPYVPEGPSVLHIIGVESKRHTKVELIPGGYPVFSADASRFAVASEDGRRIQVYDRATGSTVVLKPRLDDGEKLWINGVSWSPDGDRVLSYAQRGPDSAGGPYARVSIAPDGSSVEVLTPWTTGHFPL